MSTLHLLLHVGLASFVVVAGVAFLTMAAIAYRRSMRAAAAQPTPDPSRIGRAG